MPKLPDWQLRQILPALVFVSRAAPTPNRALEATIADMVLLAQRRGMQSLLARLEHDAAVAAAANPLYPEGSVDWETVAPRDRQKNGPTEADPFPHAVSTAR